MAELVDAWVSKTHEGNFVRVRFPLSAQGERKVREGVLGHNKFSLFQKPN